MSGCLLIAFKANCLLCVYPGGCRCNTASSRLAAYEVLLMLGDSSLSNLRLITRELLFMHHQSDPSLCKEFDVRCSTKYRLMPSCFTCETKLLLLSLSFCQYLPPVESRAASGFVGLKNGGATCYMNAVFQQLYMQPGLAEVRRTSCRHQGAGYQVISISKCGLISGLPLH